MIFAEDLDDLDQRADLDLESGLLADLAAGGVGQPLARDDPTARQGPTAEAGRPTTTDEDHPIHADQDHRADREHRTHVARVYGRT